MKITKRAFLILLSLLMLITAVPFVSLSASAATVECQVDGTDYGTLKDAIDKKVNKATKNIEITLLSDVSWTTINQSIATTRDVTVTINGNGHTLTTSGDGNVFLVNENLIIKNLILVHNATGSLFQVVGPVSVDFDNVFVDASAYVKRRYTVINAIGANASLSEQITFNFTNTDMILRADTAKFGNTVLSAVRTGNGGDKVTVTMTDCNIDVSGAGTGHGIHVTSDTTATVNLNNTNIKAGIGYAVHSAGQTVNVNGGILETSRNKFDNTKTDATFKDKDVISDVSKTTFTASAPKCYIYGHQSTAASGGTFDVRFIVAVKNEVVEKYDSLKMEISVANATTLKAKKEYTITGVYETLSASDKSGNMTAQSLSGYKFAAKGISGIDAGISFTFTVRLSYMVDGVEHTAGSETITYTNGAYSNSKYDAFDYALNASDLTGRYLLVSDLHYVGSGSRSSGDPDRYTYRGLDTDARMALLCKHIKEEAALRGLDAVFVLGDLSTDDWYSGAPTSHLDKSYCQKVYTDYLKPTCDQLGIPVYILPGNHDSYPTAKWQELFGSYGIIGSRQYVVEDGDNVFIMCDTFDSEHDAKFDNNLGNGNEFVGVNTSWLSTQLEKYKNKKNVFICSHEFGSATEAVMNIIKNYDNVVCMFEGHTHHYSGSGAYGVAKQGEVEGSYKVLINTGNFSYGNYDSTYTYDFGKLCDGCTNDYECLWGFQIVETTADNVSTYRVYVEHTYSFNTYKAQSNSKTGTITHVQPYTKYGDIVFR